MKILITSTMWCLLHPLPQHFHYGICVSGYHLPISYLHHEGPHFNKLLLSEGMFHYLLIDGCINEEVSTQNTSVYIERDTLS